MPFPAHRIHLGAVTKQKLNNLIMLARRPMQRSMSLTVRSVYFRPIRNKKFNYLSMTLLRRVVQCRRALIVLAAYLRTIAHE
jgi:hypothetical protein